MTQPSWRPHCRASGYAAASGVSSLSDWANSTGTPLPNGLAQTVTPPLPPPQKLPASSSKLQRMPLPPRTSRGCGSYFGSPFVRFPVPHPKEAVVTKIGSLALGEKSTTLLGARTQIHIMFHMLWITWRGGVVVKAPRTIAAGIAAIGLAVAGLAVGPPASAATDFYVPPTTIAGNPGDLIRSEKSTFYLDPLRAIKAPATAQRVMYVSTGLAGEKTAVTGTVLTPTTAWLGTGPRPVVSFAVGTQGMGDACAPSRQLASGWEYEGVLIKGLLLKGYSVSITDYQGLGTPGTHPYVNGPILGRNVLDAARASKRLAAGAVAASAPVYIMGYSEGGNAAASALEQRATYAPDVNVVAGAVGAVPANLAGLGTVLDGTVYAAFQLYVLVSIADAYPQLHLRDSLNERGKAVLAAASESCTIDGLARFALSRSTALTVDGTSLAGLLLRPDFAAVLEELRIGKTAPDVPVVLSHSKYDDVVPYEQGKNLALQWCAGGAVLRFESSVLPGHVGGYPGAYASAITFFAGRAMKLPITNRCVIS